MVFSLEQQHQAKSNSQQTHYVNRSASERVFFISYVGRRTYNGWFPSLFWSSIFKLNLKDCTKQNSNNNNNPSFATVSTTHNRLSSITMVQLDTTGSFEFYFANIQNGCNLSKYSFRIQDKTLKVRLFPHNIPVLLPGQNFGITR